MKTILTILAIMVVSAIYAQTPKKMVLIPDYSIEQERKVYQRILREQESLKIYTKPYIRVNTTSQDIFVIGNFNRVSIIRPIINIPTPTIDDNNAEYVKSSQFNPNKTLQEILRNDKP